MSRDAGGTPEAGPQAPAGDDDPQAQAGGGNEGAIPDRLSFLDLFYSLPVGDLAVRVSSAQLGKVTAAAWTTMGVELAALFFSWLGLHQNRATMISRKVPDWWVTRMSFLSARFVQFSVEIAITALYFVIGLTINLSSDPASAGKSGPPLPSETWVVTTLLVIFGAYLVWDVLDAYIAAKHGDWDWLWRAATGGAVTTVFTAVLLIVFIVIEVTHAPRADSSITITNFALVALLYTYRVGQERVEAAVETWDATGWVEHRWAQSIVNRTGRIMNGTERLLTRGS